MIKMISWHGNIFKIKIYYLHNNNNNKLIFNFLYWTIKESKMQLWSTCDSNATKK